VKIVAIFRLSGVSKSHMILPDSYRAIRRCMGVPNAHKIAIGSFLIDSKIRNSEI